MGDSLPTENSPPLARATFYLRKENLPVTYTKGGKTFGKRQISLPVKDDYHHQDPAMFHPLPKHDRQKGGMDSPQCSFFRDEIFFLCQDSANPKPCVSKYGIRVLLDANTPEFYLALAN